jgi:hypothetical protein
LKNPTNIKSNQIQNIYGDGHMSNRKIGSDIHPLGGEYMGAAFQRMFEENLNPGLPKPKVCLEGFPSCGA